MTATRIRAVCFDWGGTLMSEEGPHELPMALWREVRVLPGAGAMLAALHGGYPLCIATNASVSRRPMIERALERVGLGDYFAQVFCFTELRVRKESPAFWHTVARVLGVELHEIAMLGDALEPDVLVPRALGVHAVWFNEGGLRPAPDPGVPTVTRLGEFVEFVRALG
jgi:FMN phosphatase YigB (HAD superfamily)